MRILELFELQEHVARRTDGPGSRSPIRIVETTFSHICEEVVVVHPAYTCASSSARRSSHCRIGAEIALREGDAAIEIVEHARRVALHIVGGDCGGRLRRWSGNGRHWRPRGVFFRVAEDAARRADDVRFVSFDRCTRSTCAGPGIDEVRRASVLSPPAPPRQRVPAASSGSTTSRPRVPGQLHSGARGYERQGADPIDGRGRVDGVSL